MITYLVMELIIQIVKIKIGDKPNGLRFARLWLRRVGCLVLQLEKAGKSGVLNAGEKSLACMSEES